MGKISLITSIKELNAEITEILTQLDILKKEKINNYEQLELFKSKKSEWIKSAEELFERNFDDSENFFKNEFKGSVDIYLGGIYFIGMNETFEDKVRDSKRSLFSYGNFLAHLMRLIPELDDIIGNEPIIESENADIEDVFYLILYKLKQLKGKEHISIKYILLGNGIRISSKDEIRELIGELSDKYFIQTSGEYDARITVKGELQLNKLSKSRERITTRQDKNSIDDVISELKKLGLGQEILFEELEELKSLSTKLSNKNWKQIVKGKLIDLTLSKVIRNDVAKLVFDKIVPGDGCNNLLK